MSTKETKEALVGFISLAGLLAEAFKDGVQATDIVQVYAKIESDPVLKQKIVDMYNGMNQVPSELKDLSLVEGIELLTEALPEIVALIGKIKK